MKLIKIDLLDQKKSFNNDTWRRKKPKISALEYKDDTDKISKKINVNLNKLSDSNFDAISNNIVELISEHSFFNNLFRCCF